MPYYGHIYYGYGDFLANNLYVLLLIPVLLLSLWAQFQVSGSFRRYNAVNNRRRITGAQAAEAVLRAHGVFGVPVRPCRGNLTDHYDPRDNTIYLSETVYDAPTIAAVGVAAHEAGHAVQYAENYGPVRLRTAIIPATRIGSSLSFILLLVGLVLYNQSLFFIGIVLFSFTTLFQLVTLPVEFNASARAVRLLDSTGILRGEEVGYTKQVLGAAALTYVATMVVRIPSPMQGYVNLGDCCVLLSGWILGPWWGGAAAGIGSMLTDLLNGYAHYAPGTLVIKALDAMAAALIVKALGRKPYAYVVGGVVGELIMVAGYFGYACLLLGKGIGAAASIPGNLVQGAMGLVIGLVLFVLLKRSKALDKLNIQW